ncbi:DUF1330 domain-containing protein [Rhodococcus hoagii]|nr:DUF1330 domain-containing protein [Prescottella equi]
MSAFVIGVRSTSVRHRRVSTSVRRHRRVPGSAHALQWYRSDAYQRIVGLRTENSDSTVLIVDEVAHPHRATEVITRAS